MNEIKLRERYKKFKEDRERQKRIKTIDISIDINTKDIPSRKQKTDIFWCMLSQSKTIVKERRYIRVPKYKSSGKITVKDFR